MENHRESLVRGYTGRLFLIVGVGWFGVQIGRHLIPPLLPAIIADFEISSFQAGASLTVLGMLYASSHYPGGRLADQLSRKTVLVFGLTVMTVGFFLLRFATEYFPFLFAVALVGLGAGLYYISKRSLNTDMFVANRSLAFGIQNSFGNIGSAAAGGVAILVVTIGGWRSAFFPVALLLGAVLVSSHRCIEEPYSVKRVEIGLFGTLRRIVYDGNIRRVLIAYVLLIFTWHGVIGFLPTFLQTDKGFSLVFANGGFTIVFVTGIVTGPIAGKIGDAFEKLLVAVVALSLVGGGLSLLVSVDSPTAILFGMVVFSIGFWSFPPVMHAHLMGTFDRESMGGDFGAFKTIYSGIGSLGPSYVGLVGGMWSFTIAYYGLIGCLVVSLLVVVSIRRSADEDANFA